MIGVEIKGANEIASRIKNFGGNVAFASARAINDTLQAVQKFELESQLPSKLTLRSRGTPWQQPGTKFGLNIKPFASKAKMLGTLGSQANWLRLQEFGGTKTVSGHRLAIPLPEWKPKSEIMQRNKKPAAILKRRASFIGPRQPRSKSSSSKPRVKSGRPRTGKGRGLKAAPFIYSGEKMPAGIYVRTGKPRLPIKMLFRLKPSANVKRNLKFGESAKAAAEAEYGPAFTARLAEAMQTAKLK